MVRESVSEILASAEDLLAQARTDDALQLLETAERRTPLDARIQRALVSAYAAAGDAVRAAAAGIAAGAIESRAALPVYNLATGYFMFGQNQPAEKWYRVALALDPGLAMAHQNLAAILQNDGRVDEAQRHRELAYAKQWIFTDAAAHPAATVLVTCAGGLGNVPIENLLPAQRFYRIKCFVDYARLDDGTLAQTRPHDLVFNAIGEADAIAPDDARLLRILQFRQRPVLNPPRAVARTRRDRLPDLLQGLDGTVVPRVWRIELKRSGAAVLAEMLERENAQYPLILRPAGSHGGAAAALARDRRAVENSALGECDVVYATAYHDYRSADGHFRKYRMIFVDRKPYPYHLAISQQWLVHYFSAEMQTETWKPEEERRFLESPAQALGLPAMQALEAIGRRLDLDYAGADFSVLADGSVLVFEANPTMLVHPERENGPFAHKNRYVAAIVDAFGRMILARAAG
jgi:hypothetical protein